MSEEEIKEIKIGDKNYPEFLKKIADPPKVLYFRGEFIKKDEVCFAIVGTRRYSSYGKQVTLEIAGDLIDAGLTIVSGLAPGIDSFSHTACVERKKRTIAVLGTGLDEKNIYPQTNLKLADEIIKNGGCLISELLPGTSGSRFTFPQRNRIISGLSQGVLVVEAKEKSGSLITADYAFSQRRKVFAVPGPIYSLNSKGTNRLIKRGAKLVENANDILKQLNIAPAISDKKIRSRTIEEELILSALKEGPLYIDKIIEITKLSAPVVATTLALMEISGKVRNLGGSVYCLS